MSDQERADEEDAIRLVADEEYMIIDAPDPVEEPEKPEE